MHDPIPSCFHGGASAGPTPQAAAGPTQTTSVYDTPLGPAALTWSRTALGLLVRAELRPDGDGVDQETLTFKIRPWILWKRRGSKRYRHKDLFIDLAWDLSRTRFAPGGGPEPVAGFFLSVSVDGEILLVAGDLYDLALKKSKSRSITSKISTSLLISRREHVVMNHDRSYKTVARFGGKERSISIDLNGEMSLEVDGSKVLQIRRIRWKFRGSERVELEGGDRIQISWDLHNWLFQPKDESAPSSTGNAVFVFRFERDEEEGQFGKEGEGYFGKGEGEEEGVYKGMVGGYFGKSKNWSESSSGGGGVENGKKKNKKKSLLKTSSSSSSSSASSAGSSTVMEWASTEETELRSREGFSLLVYAWKS